MNIQEQIQTGIESGFDKIKGIFSTKAVITPEQLAEARTTIATLESSVSALNSELVALKAGHITALAAKDLEIEERANVKAAAIVAKSGHKAVKEEVTAEPQGKGGKVEPETPEALWEAYHKLTDQKAKSDFYAAHPSMQPK